MAASDLIWVVDAKKREGKGWEETSVDWEVTGGRWGGEGEWVEREG